jgi:hypothetical protein
MLARALVAAPALGLVGAACSATLPPPPPPAPLPALLPIASASAAPAAAPASPATPPPPAAPVQISGWGDPGAVAHLAEDCHWAPAADDQGTWALSCEIHPDQNCNPNECDDVEERCYPGCTVACATCAEQCVDGCESCKRGCRDDACRRGCAENCGACRRECLREKDLCASAKCGQEAVECSMKLRADYEKSRCPKLVDKLSPCVDACVAKAEKEGKGSDYSRMWDCQSGCIGRVMPGCVRFFSYFRRY